MNYYLILDADGFIVGVTFNDTPPPGDTVIADKPPPPDVSRVKTRYEDGQYVTDGTLWVPATYAQERRMAYPPVTDYLDAVVKGDQAQIDEYIQKCLDVKAKYPKPQIG